MMPPKASHNAGQLRSVGRTCGKRTPHNQRGRSGQAGDKIHRGIRLRVGPCKTEEYYAGKNGGACLNNL